MVYDELMAEVALMVYLFKKNTLGCIGSQIVVNCDTIISIIEDDNMSGNELQFVFEFLLDVHFHCVGENMTVLHNTQVEVPSVS